MKRLALLIAASFLLASQAKAEEAKSTYHVLDVEKFAFEHKWADKIRDPYIPDEKNWRIKDNLYWNVSIGHIFFWDNNVEMYSTDTHVLSVGWQFYMGFHVNDWLDLVKDHHSRHVLEQSRPTAAFPVEDSYGFRLNFINK